MTQFKLDENFSIFKGFKEKYFKEEDVRKAVELIKKEIEFMCSQGRISVDFSSNLFYNINRIVGDLGK